MARLIKRYENRKLYDTEASSYVSLSDVADLVRSGETVRVEDTATGRDITAQTLTQIILEEGKNGRNVLPSEMLHALVRQSSRALDSGFTQLKHSVDELLQSSMSQLSQLVQSPRARKLEELREQLLQLEAQLADLLEEVERRQDADSEQNDSA